MSIEVLAMIFLAGMLLAIFIGLPVAIALGSVGLLGLFYMGGLQAVTILSGGTALYQLSHFGLLAIPLFMLLSATIKASGIGSTIVDLVIKWLYRIPGALHSAAVVSCAIFAAMSSSSVATAAAVGGLILPEMKERGHNLRLGIGSVAIGGTLGIMIPPSNYFILYGVLTETSITKLFMAGIVPGLMIVTVMIVFNSILFKFYPKLSPTENLDDAPSWPEKWQALRRAWTGLILIVAVVGGIFLGVVTPTEAGGLGAVIALLIGMLVLKTISKNKFIQILIEAVQTTSMIGFIIFGGLLLARASTMMNLSSWLIVIITQSGLSPWEVMLLINLLLLFLGMFMDASAITILTVPLLFPVIVELGFDPIWFAVVVALNMELALVTPPVGLNIFVLKAVAGVPLREAVLGTLPYAALLFVCLGLIMVFPQIALWLPGYIQ
jgi:C4-dicarboxylate transporter, DctM subunit